jgi:hypothetical protein
LRGDRTGCGDRRIFHLTDGENNGCKKANDYQKDFSREELTSGEEHPDHINKIRRHFPLASEIQDRDKTDSEAAGQTAGPADAYFRLHPAGGMVSDPPVSYGAGVFVYLFRFGIR